MLEHKVNCPLTSSAGRLFDAIAGLIGIRQRSSFEGQAAMELEFALNRNTAAGSYHFDIQQAPGESVLIVDWGPMVQEVLDDVSTRAPVAEIAAKFHNTLVEMIATVAHTCREPRVVLTGGCFQNRVLTERAVTRLGDAGFRPYWHQRVPPNDGGIALGQAATVLHSFRPEN
jgi:hydrogenase maturation protein HypF